VLLLLMMMMMMKMNPGVTQYRLMHHHCFPVAGDYHSRVAIWL